MYQIQDIRTIHLEVTQKCQAACPMCDRNMRGEGINPHINLDELTLEDCKKIFLPEFIKQLNTMYMCGNLGDPIIAKDTLAIFSYFRDHNPTMWLSMNTNGGARDVRWWQELADTIGKNGAVIFSVDGLRDTNHLYRQGVNWDLVQRNMNAYINHGGRARWDFLVFEYNQHQVEEARQLSLRWGVERFIAKKTARFVKSNSEAKEEHQAKDHKGNDTTNIKKPEPQYQNEELKKQALLIEQYGSMDAYYEQVPIKCKVKDEGSLFITAEGLVMPCCWTAGRMYKWWHKDPKVEQIWAFIEMSGGKEALDARQGLDKVFQTGIFDRIENAWNKNDRLKVCAMKCGIAFDPFTAQFQ